MDESASWIFVVGIFIILAVLLAVGTGAIRF